MIKKLLPCPFCGCQMGYAPNPSGWSISGQHGDNCPFSKYGFAFIYDSTENAEKAWNTRVVLGVGLDLSDKLSKNQWVLWRWKKKCGSPYEESQIIEMRGDMILLGYPTNPLSHSWVYRNEISIGWIGDSEGSE